MDNTSRKKPLNSINNFRIEILILDSKKNLKFKFHFLDEVTL